MPAARQLTLGALCALAALAPGCRVERAEDLPPPAEAAGAFESTAPDCLTRSQSLRHPDLSFNDLLVCLDSAPEAAQEPLIQRGLELAAGNELRTAYVEHYSALLAQNRGEFRRALELGRRSGEVFRRLGKTSWYAASLHNQGVLASSLGRGRQALALYERALEIQRRSGDREAQAALQTQIGWVFLLMGNTGRAGSYLREALALRTTDYGRAVTLDRLGSVYRDSGRPAQALRCYRRALAVFERRGDPLRGHVLANLGWLYLNLREDNAAETHLRKALPLLQAVGDLDAQAHVLAGLAEAARRNGDPEQALALLERALWIVGRLRRASPAEHSFGSNFLALRQDYFTQHVGLLIELSRLAPGRSYDRRAFLAEERRRARALLDLLYQGPRDTEVWDGEHLRLFDRLRVEITYLELGLRRSPSEAEQRRLTGRLYERLAEYEMLRSAPASAAPAALPGELLIGVDEAQRSLDPATSVLAYSLGDERSFLFLLNHESFEIFDLPPRAEIETAARDYYDLLTAGDHFLNAGQIQVVGAALSSMLLAPVRGRLGRRVIVLKDGALHRVPFAALPQPGGGGRLMLADHIVTTTPSLSTLHLLDRRRPRPGSDRVVVVAPDAGGGRNTDGSRFPPLRSAEAEVAAIARTVPGQRALILAGRDANRERLRALGSMRILHFVTHAYNFPGFPELSAILLADRDGGDDLLRLHEIFDLSFPAELVVLSACQTGLGDLLRGEGMVSMTQGFLGAGAQGVVVSFWPVDDEATAALMGRFYESLLVEGNDAAIALRDAQLALSTGFGGKWSAPYYWAGFELQGR